MSSPWLAAVVQMNSQTDRAANVASAAQAVTTAAQRGARLVVLPEMFTCYGPAEAILAAAEPVPGPTSAAMSRLARELQITLVAGSIPERTADPRRVFNTSLVFGPDGQMAARYRKLHLFDVALSGRAEICESNWSLPGDELVVADVAPARLGQAICYDLRFPELFRELMAREARIVALPSAFTQATGCDHWEVLLRARAIENQMFVLAANQWGRHGDKLVTYGRSMIVDPWGTVLATAGDGAGLAIAELDLARQSALRAQLPALAHRRLPLPPHA